MKQKTNRLTCLLAAVLFAGCSGSELPEGLQPAGPSEADIPLNVTVASLEAEVESAPGTRATTNLGSGTSIGIFRDNTNGYTAASNIRYNYGSPKWAPQTASETIYLGLLPVNVCAYHPWSSGKTTAIALTSGVYAATNDLSYATNQSVDGRTNKTTALTFAMKRAYSRVTLTISRDATYSAAMGSCKINQVGFKPVAGTLSAVTSLDISKEMSAQTASASSGLVYNTVASDDINAGINVGASGSIDLLIPPTTVSAEMLLTVTVDGEARAVSIPAASLGTLAAGKHYAIQAKIVGLALLQLQAVTTINQDWSSIPTTPNGSFEEVKPQI